MPDARNEIGLHVHTSNRMELLAEELCRLTRQPLSSPFQAETVVVQSQGMARWLKLELARANGVCAHYHFPFPKAFVQETVRAVLPELPEESTLDPETMIWRVLKSVRQLKDRPAFAPVRDYLGDDQSGRKEVQLAAKVAHLFDQYLIFRSQWMEGWLAGEGDHWQAELWRAVAAGQALHHPAMLHREFAHRWRQAAALLKTMPERVSIFGISALPPFYLDFFGLLGERLPVHLFLLQPSRKYWGDITSAREDERLLRQARLPESAAFQLHLDTGNTLLASLGYLGRDFLKLVLEAGDWTPHERFTGPDAQSLLQRIQADVLELQDRGRDEDCPQTAIPPDDDSIQLHSCHSPLREMEVLYDHMLDWFQRDPSLAPRDIVVMMPDIDTYAPIVQAVFGSPQDDARRIPFSLADRGARQDSHLVETFLQILQLPQSRLGASTVLAPLEARSVRDRFQLSEPDVALIRRWVEQTNIRWGIDAAHRQELDLPALNGNTWREGLDRLMLGYAMSGNGEELFASKLPFDDIEGAGAVVLGRFAEYLERIFAAVADLKSAQRSLREWSITLGTLLDQFFRVDDLAEREAQTVRGALEELARQQELSGFANPIPVAVVLERLLPRLEEDRFGSGFLTGGVTFCGLKPMRSVPFKIICLVGMNDNAFPRPISQLSFDLMAQKPVLGDRSTREDDRYLFLETLLSARRRLYLSYVGRSIRDNTEAPPSVLVSELLDYIAQGFAATNASDATAAKSPEVRDHILTRHRLQAFSEAYFREDKRLFSYSTANCRASQAAQGQRQPNTGAFFEQPLGEPEAEFKRVDLGDLAEFFVNPARFLLTRRMGVLLLDNHEELEEREAFVLDTLDRYQLRQELVASNLERAQSGNALPILQASGRLPLGKPGESSFQETKRFAEAFSERVRQQAPGEPVESLSLDHTLAEFQLTGRIDRLTTAGLLHYRCADIKAKDLLRLWIPHLTIQLVRPATPSTLIGSNHSFRVKPCTNAEAVLKGLLDLYWRGLREPLRFFPESAQAFAETRRKMGKTPPLSAARTKWEGNAFTSEDYGAERNDPYFDLCFRNLDPLDADFISHACDVFDPILEHLTPDAR